MVRKERILLSALLSAVISLTACGLAPMRILADNSSLLWFPVSYIDGSIVFLVGTAFILILLLSYLLSGITTIIFPVLLGTGVAMYVQCELLHFGYGPINGAAISWGSFGVWPVANTLIWVLMIAAAIFLFREKRKWFTRTAVCLSAVLVILELITAGTMVRKCDLALADRQNEVCLSTRGINEVSGEENVVVFAFDTFDDQHFQEILEKEPDFLKPLQGFTYFANNTGMYPTAEGAIPYILSGQVNQNEKPYDTYIEEAYAATEYYDDLKAAGYDIGIYTDLRYVDSEALLPMLSNYEEITDEQTSSKHDLVKQLYKAAAFRYLPHIAKGAVWYSPSHFTSWKISNTESGHTPYKTGNMDFYEAIKDGQLHMNNTEESCYRVFYCKGDTLRRNRAEGSTTDLDMAKSCLKIVYDYIEQLKQLDVYNKTTILIVSGNGDTTKKLSAPLFLAKPQNMWGKLKISDVPVCQEDLFATVMTSIGLNEAEKYGQSAFQYKEGEWRIRKYLDYNPAVMVSTQLPALTEYTVAPENNKSESFIKEEDYLAIEYELGAELKFSTKDTEGFEYCINGFSIFEEMFTWTDGKRAMMAFEIEDVSSRDLLVSIDLSTVYNPPQRLIICMKEQELFQKEIESGGRLEFIIPAEYIQDEVIELTFYMPDAVSPKTLGKGGDVRVLALGFESMCIDPYRGISKETLAKVADYNLGERLYFAEENPTAEPYCLSGFHGFEPRSSWTTADSMCMAFRITDEIQDDLRLTMETDAVYNGSQEVQITMDGQELFHKVMDTVEPIEFVIPAELIQYEELVLNFSFPDAVSPYELGESEDVRDLAIGIVSTVIQYASEAE